MPSRAGQERRWGARAATLLGGVAGGLLLAACSDVKQPSVSPQSATTATHAPASSSTASTRGADLGVFEVSCYTGKGVTALGKPNSRETVSVDPRVVPLGTRLLIDKVGTRVAADIGGGVKGRRLDIWEPSAAACTRFGRRQLRVWQAS